MRVVFAEHLSQVMDMYHMASLLLRTVLSVPSMITAAAAVKGFRAERPLTALGPAAVVLLGLRAHTLFLLYMC